MDGETMMAGPTSRDAVFLLFFRKILPFKVVIYQSLFTKKNIRNEHEHEHRHTQLLTDSQCFHPSISLQRVRVDEADLGDGHWDNIQSLSYFYPYLFVVLQKFWRNNKY